MFEYGAYERDPMHFVFNILLFVPLGVLLHQEGRPRSDKLLPIVMLATTVGLLTSTAIEYMQGFLPSRDSSLIDVLGNTLGAGIGAAIGCRWGTAVAVLLMRIRAAISSAALAGLVGSCLVVALLISATLQARTRLVTGILIIRCSSATDTSETITAGAAVCSHSTSPTRQCRLRTCAGFPSANQSQCREQRWRHLISAAGRRYPDASGHLPDLERAEHSSASAQLGDFPSTWLQSDGSVEGLAERLRRTNAFTLRVRCATADIGQDGPGRIISNSLSSRLSNFSLGQRGNDLVFHLRTPATGVDRYPVEIVVPGVFANFDAREILASYDGATLLVAVAHGDEVSSTELTPGSSVALAIPTLYARPEEFRQYELAYLATLSVVPAMLIGFLAHTRRDRWGFSVAWVLALSVLLEVTLVQVSGRPPMLAEVATNAGVGALVLTAFNVILFSADAPTRRPVPVGAMLRPGRAEVSAPVRHQRNHGLRSACVRFGPSRGRFLGDVLEHLLWRIGWPI